MQIRMKAPYDNGTLNLAVGSDGEGLTAKQKRQFVRAGLAEEVKPKPAATTAPAGAAPAQPARARKSRAKAKK